MYLNDDEKRMLAGEEGQLVQEAMKFLVDLGGVFGASRMIDIGFAFCYVSNQMEGLKNLPRSIDPELLLRAIDEGVTVKVPTIGGLGSVDPDIWREMKVPEAVYERYLRDTEIEARLGIHPVSTCTPYMVTDMNQVPFGTHMVTIESSAIPFYNSVLGARVNRGGISGFFAAITGKYPEFGYHLDENRYATIEIDVQTPLETLTDFGALGMFSGERCKTEVPVFSGITKADMPQLIALSSAIATGGAVSLFHIPGITPEFKDRDSALNHRPPAQVLTFGEKDLREVYNRYPAQAGDAIDMVLVGCPHYSIHQLREVAGFLKGRKKNDTVELIMSTAPQTKYLASQMGYVKTIEEAGAMLIARTCPIIGAGCPGPVHSFTHPDYSAGTVATDSLKVAAYAKSSLSARRVVLGSTTQCLEAAITGKWGDA